MLISVTKATEAAEVLGVNLEGLTTDILTKAYRRCAKECHPDHHKSAKLGQWARVSWANECLKLWLEKHPAEHHEETTEIVIRGDCRACGGTGRVRVGTGFSKLTMQCVICAGLGTVEPKEIDDD